MSKEQIDSQTAYLNHVLEELETLGLDPEESYVYGYVKKQAELQIELMKNPAFKLFKKLGAI